MALPPAREAAKRATHPGMASQARFLTPGQMWGMALGRVGEGGRVSIKGSTWCPRLFHIQALSGARDSATVMVPFHGGKRGSPLP